MSVMVQKEPNYHIVSKDDFEDDYIEMDVLTVFPGKQEGRACNLYFNEMRHFVPGLHPWVIFLDDDDTFTTPEALTIIREHTANENNLILWRVNIGGHIIPDKVPKVPGKPGDVTGIGFCVHIKNWIDWPGVPSGDFEVIREYHKKLNPVWINEVLTAAQRGPGLGLRIDF